MSGFYGNNIARLSRIGIAKVGPGSWTPLVASGTSSLPGRQWIKVQVKGRNALAVTYKNKGTDGSFTAPTESAHVSVVYPANSIFVDPIGDSIMAYGRSLAKAGSTDGGLRVIVAEFS